jgi:hypothetical protein
LNVNAGIIHYCCQRKNDVKSGYSKSNDEWYTFEYTNDEITKIIPRKNARAIKPPKIKIKSDKTPAQRYLEKPENKAKHLNYMKTKVNCMVCQKMVARSNMSNHNKTKSHLFITQIENI